MNDDTIEIDITQYVHGVIDALAEDLPEECVLAALCLSVAASCEVFGVPVDEAIEMIREAASEPVTIQ